MYSWFLFFCEIVSFENQHTKYAKLSKTTHNFKSSAKHVPVFMILEVRLKINKKRNKILFLLLPLQYLKYVKRSMGWQTFLYKTFCMKQVKQKSFKKSRI